MKDNFSVQILSQLQVVNCFQKLLSSWWRTTSLFHTLPQYELWIAFKNYYLRDEGQPFWYFGLLFFSCELLSKIIIFVMKDNLNLNSYCQKFVVNCFQKLLSSWWRTTIENGKCNSQMLWIAFKNYYLRDEGQPIGLSITDTGSCELLSKIIIFVMKDNTESYSKNSNKVVNCFQKLLSSWWRTTISRIVPLKYLLWIAFKNYYLRDEGQHCVIREVTQTSCELLSKIIIFVMKDNNSRICPFFHVVVNCFQKLLSSWWRTTSWCLMYQDFLLWIAFKNYYLRDEGQLHRVFVIVLYRCELLSKIIIFVMKDNLLNGIMTAQNVVNCFQKLLSSWWRTTKMNMNEAR